MLNTTTITNLREILERRRISMNVINLIIVLKFKIDNTRLYWRTI